MKALALRAFNYSALEWTRIVLKARLYPTRELILIKYHWEHCPANKVSNVVSFGTDHRTATTTISHADTDSALTASTSKMAAVASSKSNMSETVEFLLDSGEVTTWSDTEIGFKTSKWLNHGVFFFFLEIIVMCLQQKSEPVCWRPVCNSVGTFTTEILSSNLLYVWELKSNLLSCAALCDEVYTVNFNSMHFVELFRGVTKFQGRKENCFFKVSCRPIVAGHANAHITQLHSGKEGSASDMDI